MTDSKPDPSGPPRPRRRWVGPLAFVLAAVVVGLLGLLAVSIMERRWEARRPALVLAPLDPWEADTAVWGRNYPLEYETYRLARDDTTRTRYGGASPRDYLDEDPNLVVLWAGYGFSKDYRQARGHPYALTDVAKTGRLTPKTVGSCWTCKSADVPRLLDAMGPAEFYASNFHALADEIHHPVGCRDCHDPRTLELRITRPALREALAARGRNPDDVTHQEMRSLLCAQCHAEYYFKDGSYVTFPWEQGTTVDAMLAYYTEAGFADFTHAVSGTPVVKAQHPDYEIYATGIHAYRDVACADCHMPYVSRGGVKVTDHHVQSPLLAVSRSCAVCHRWSEEAIRTRVEAIQEKVQEAERAAERALVRAHFDVAAAVQSGVGDAPLAGPRDLIRRAQFRWDCASSQNGMGFHSPQETMRLLARAADLAQQARLRVARLLAAKGVGEAPVYPDIGTRAQAEAVVEAFTAGEPIRLLPAETPPARKENR